MPDTSRTTRRRFLKRAAALGTGVVAAPYIIPRQVMATQDQPGANDRIGMGGIGIGRQGSGRILATGSQARVVAIADVNLPRAKEMAARFDGAVGYQNYHELLERKDIDAIVTATPDHWRALVCIHACQAGKDIYAEKPMNLTIREGRLMVQAVRKYKRVFQTGSQQRSDPKNRYGCELIRNNRIGKIEMVIGHNYPSPWECDLPGQPVPQGLDWDMWCGPTEVVPYHVDLYTPRRNPGWISFRPYSGGEVTGWGAHGLDQIQCALGMDDTGPVEIWTEGDAFDPPTYTEPESRARGEKICRIPMVYFRYANGVTVKLDNGNPGGAIFIGDKGKVEIFRSRVTSNPAELAEEPIKDSDIRLYESNNHMQNWLDCIRSREKPIADVEIGHRSTSLCHLVNIARWVGHKLRWDPEKETFPGDEEANSYLDRPRRKPYELPETV